MTIRLEYREREVRDANENGIARREAVSFVMGD